MARLSNNDAFETWNSQLRCDIDHAVCGTCTWAFSGENRLPHHRLYLVHSAPGPAASTIALSDEPTTPLAAGQAYLIPGDRRLRFQFSLGIRLVAIHFALYLPPGFDLLRMPEDIRSRGISRRQCALIERHLRDAAAPGTVLQTKALLLQAITPFVDISAGEAQHILRVQARYADTLAAIDHAGADCRIADLTPARMKANTFARRFARDSGTSLKQLLQRSLLLRASRLLAETDLPIQDISERLRFSSAFHFSKFFKQHTGQPPSRYRQFLLSGTILPPAGAGL